MTEPARGVSRFRMALPGFNGRRKSDRWLTYMFLLLQFVMVLFILYTSFEQGRAERDATEAAAARERAENQRAELTRLTLEQGKLLLCLTVDAESFDVALADAILATPPRPETVEQYKHLAAVRDRMRAGEAAKPKPSDCGY